MPKKLDEKGKSKKNLQQQIRHTKDRMQDTEFALENESMSQGRRKELEIKNEQRRKDVRGKTKELKE
ncbi:MAG: hypothetical protein QM451_01950 [Bacillota bacterium]|jgi:hypothetical protein|nr:hypothetical protein [Bacillota bacterium]HHT89355.1 hypothetical protein [Bacillota bacterium]